MTSCMKGMNPVCNPNGPNFYVEGCWQGYDSTVRLNDRCHTKKTHHYNCRRRGRYNSIEDTGPLGHPKANGFSSVLFQSKLPVYLWLDNATKHGRGPKRCRYRCKGHHRLGNPSPTMTSTPTNQGGGRTVAPPFQSYETVLAVRKAQAAFDPRNFKKSKKWCRDH